MSKIIYSVNDSAPYVTFFKKSNSPILEIEVSARDSGKLRIGEKNYKISHGVAKIPKSELKNGSFCPLFINAEGSLLLPELEFFANEVISLCDMQYAARLSCELIELKKRTLSLEEQIEKINKTVYGTKIF